MERLNSLNRYQKAVLLFMTVMMLVFAVLYARSIAREGFAYRNAILIPSERDGATVYSGKIRGKTAEFTVRDGRTAEFRYGDRYYGSYTMKKDPAAVPEEYKTEEGIIGVELCRGTEVLFRGGVQETGGERWLYEQDAVSPNVDVSLMAQNDLVLDERLTVPDFMEPSVSTILDLMLGPELSHKGSWRTWMLGVFLCVLTAASMLYADELFRWHLSFQIRGAEQAEPSDWEIAGRYLTWTLMPILVLALLISGLY